MKFSTFVSFDDEYLDVVEYVLQHGVKRMDRTGTGTLGKFAQQMRFDLRQGFPLLTTKKVHFKSVVHELLWMLRGSTNVKELQAVGVRIWNEWRMPYTLDRAVEYVERRAPTLPAPYHGDFSYAGLNIAAGSDDERLAQAWTKMMRRCYDPSHHRYALYGAVGATVHPRWHTPANFIADVKSIPHWYYKQTNWNEFELDKDYYGAAQYGPDTSVWLRTDENNFYTSAANPVKVTRPDGDELVFVTQAAAARAMGLSTATLSRFLTQGVPTVLKGKNKPFAGYAFDIVDETRLVRLRLIDDGELGSIYSKQWRSWQGANGNVVDQIAQVQESLRKNPDSRRHIVSAWNPADVDKMALPPCHAMFQFFSEPQEDGTRLLHCHLYQRSADLFLGVPFNIASYALLTMMMAQTTGHLPGEFVHTLGDAHIYLNHLEQVKEQLTREPFSPPTVKLNPDVKNILDFKFEDITLENYQHHPELKGRVAV